MEFKENEAIYLQIARYINENILTGNWRTDEKILSVRDLAIKLQVNPNTVMRSYEYLQNKEIIYNKRGIGFFVGGSAVKKIKAEKRDHFLNEELPLFFKTMNLLNIGMDEIAKRFDEYLSEIHQSQISENENQ
ncbi:GntR family transcriptional regulator [Arcticibacter tournemirensis]|uniref:GntR family transcriptional regulator n=1 Tax=Arcticibacter tournemirensis TaxID=699437 RepID=A0A4Q0M7T4_9SPHI|nr:GntR family transcriptional regulator [Arcticibacter tournemirensis]RXF69075.1 GntR family transcriptional regulator [Arcticibacter tournemirensis]